MSLRDEIFDEIYNDIPEPEELVNWNQLVTSVFKNILLGSRICPLDWWDTAYVDDVFYSDDIKVYPMSVHGYYTNKQGRQVPFRDTFDLRTTLGLELLHEVKNDYDMVIHNALEGYGIIDEFMNILEDQYGYDFEYTPQYWGDFNYQYEVKENMKSLVHNSFNYNSIVKAVKDELFMYSTFKMRDLIVKYDDFSKIFCEFNTILRRLDNLIGGYTPW